MVVRGQSVANIEIWIPRIRSCAVISTWLTACYTQGMTFRPRHPLVYTVVPMYYSIGPVENIFLHPYDFMRFLLLAAKVSSVVVTLHDFVRSNRSQDRHV
ncbi:hypothetical protein OH76DRAFT_1396328 [Lentinus brumalis]|uniref:Uncharacterized protein n=1 Tax=Lentinus brumalis TaxID=2498619 RepID=A0A371DU01_9APHY|nr:hypothetical protein OH76DRAFT_1396328 [Polyporus brumalis]